MLGGTWCPTSIAKCLLTLALDSVRVPLDMILRGSTRILVGYKAATATMQLHQYLDRYVRNVPHGKLVGQKCGGAQYRTVNEVSPSVSLPKHSFTDSARRTVLLYCGDRIARSDLREHSSSRETTT